MVGRERVVGRVGSEDLRFGVNAAASDDEEVGYSAHAYHSLELHETTENMYYSFFQLSSEISLSRHRHRHGQSLSSFHSICIDAWHRM